MTIIIYLDYKKYGVFYKQNA